MKLVKVNGSVLHSLLSNVLRKEKHLLIAETSSFIKKKLNSINFNNDLFETYFFPEMN